MTRMTNAITVTVAKNGKFWKVHRYKMLANIDVQAPVIAKPVTMKARDQT